MPFTGVGVDIVEIARFERIMQRHPRFVVHVFTDAERLDCETSSRPAAQYAARYAARVAVSKALGSDASHPVGRNDISFETNQRGRVICLLAGKAANLAEKQGVQVVEVSLSVNRESAIANAVAVTPESRPKADKQRDAKKELAENFRKARKIIQELDSAGQSVPQEQGAADGGSEGQED